MPVPVDFVEVSTVGLESSPVAAALAGLRANEARYFKNKYDHVFTVDKAAAVRSGPRVSGSTIYRSPTPSTRADGRSM